MTLGDVFERLHHIDLAAASLLWDSGFHLDGSLGESVHPLPDAPEDAFLRDRAEQLPGSLELLHEGLCYLKKPFHGEHTLKQLPNGRYGYCDDDGEGHVFTCGQSPGAKIHYPSGRQRWVKTRIGHNGSDYFLWGLSHVPLPGLTVRERRWPV